MHITEGVLSQPVLGVGAAVAVAGVAVGLRKLDPERIPQVAVLSAAFFVASLIPIPAGVTSVHLVLNGLLGVVLGWAALPAVLVGLLLQAVIFGHGAVTALGVNTVIMGAPAIVCYALFHRACRRLGNAGAYAAGFAAGALGVALGCVLLATALLTTGREFRRVVELTLLAHIPVMVIEGLVVAHVVAFLRKVRPEMLGPPARPSLSEERTHAET